MQLSKLSLSLWKDCEKALFTWCQERMREPWAWEKACNSCTGMFSWDPLQASESSTAWVSWPLWLFACLEGPLGFPGSSSLPAPPAHWHPPPLGILPPKLPKPSRSPLSSSIPNSSLSLHQCPSPQSLLPSRANLINSFIVRLHLTLSICHAFQGLWWCLSPNCLLRSHYVPGTVRCQISSGEQKGTTLALEVKHLWRQGQVVFIYVIPAPRKVPIHSR